MSCKVGASYEAQAVVTLAGVGNIHPPACLSLCRAETGHHDCAVMERMLWVTGRLVSPHASLPAHIVPEGFPRLRWVPLLPDMIPALCKIFLRHQSYFPKDAVFCRIHG